jgi:hypothetical protein
VSADLQYERHLEHVLRRASVEKAVPEPLTRPMADARPYPVEALGPVLAPAAQAIHRVVRSPVALCGQSVLAAASLCAQRLADVEIDGRRIPLSLWFVSVAPSGERKSATDGPALAEVRAYERERLQRHGEAIRAHEMARRDWQKAQRDGGTVDPEPAPPLNPLLTTAEPTLEGLHKLLMTGTGAVGLFSDEGGAFIGGHAMNRDNQLRTAAGLSGLWDRGEADRVRAGDGAAKLYGKRLALHLLVQPIAAEKVLADPVMVGQGFLARCLLAWPQPTAGSRFYVAESLEHDPAVQAFHRRLRGILETAPTFAEGSRNELEPRVLCLTPDAKALWIAAHDEIERRQTDGAEYAQVRAWASKAAEQVLRVAGVLAVVAGTAAIDAEMVEAAARLIDWHMDEAVRLVGASHIPADVRDAEAVLAWCHQRSLSEVYSGKLVRVGPPSVRTSDRLRTIMGVLERHGWADPIDGGATIDNAHRRNAWRIHPPVGG